MSYYASVGKLCLNEPFGRYVAVVGLALSFELNSVYSTTVARHL